MKIFKRATTIFNYQQRLQTQKYCKMIEKTEKILNVKNMNQNVAQMEYAVRGPIPMRAQEIEKELRQGIKKPFERVIHANIGDCHATGQKPITFIREVMACISYPQLIDIGNFNDDVKQKAVEILSYTDGCSIGSITHQSGMIEIRQGVAEYIKNRDGYDADFNKVFLIFGGSMGVKFILSLFRATIDGKPSGVMIPVPTYPLYTASLTEYGLQSIEYYLDESKNWGLKLEELERSFEEGSKTSKIRCIVVINPGNPTGQVLTKEDIETIIKFAHERSLLVMADEVYQHNIYEGEFISFKKAIMDMGPPYDQLELVSIMSASKGYMGECGIRGGWMEVVNMDPKVLYLLDEVVIRYGQIPSTVGQAVVECIARPPKEGDPSYNLFVTEKNNVIKSLAERAALVVGLFNKMKGIKCNPLQGSMYAFPQIMLPPKAIEAAKQAGQVPDMFYAFKLLNETGICVVPGSGFGQRPGTYHFRTTILPQIDLLREMAEHFEKFHAKFTKEFS